MHVRSLAAASAAFVMTLGPAWAAGDLSAVAGRYDISPASTIRFSVAQVGGGGLTGSFPMFDGAFDLHPSDVSRSRVLIRLRPAAVVTGQPRSEAFLRSPAVFDVPDFPLITFRSIRVVPDGADSAVIDGMLTARGVSHEERFTATLLRRDGGRVAFHVTGKVLRSPYGMDVGTPIYSNVVSFDMTLVGKRRSGKISARRE